MKLSNRSSIRVLIRKQGAKAAHITLEDTTVKETVDFIKSSLKPHVDPFAEGRVTSVTVVKTASSPSEETVTETFSFRGIDPAETRLLICEAIHSLTKTKKTTTA